MASLKPLQIDLFQNPILFYKYLGPLLSQRNCSVCKMFVWISVFRRKKLYENRILGCREALEPRVLKLEGSSFGVRPSIYVWGAIKKCPTSSHSINKDSNTINSK